MSQNPQPSQGAPGHTPLSVSKSIPDDPVQIHAASSELLKAVASLGYSTASQFAIRLAFEEAILNGLRHGHETMPGTPVEVEWKAEPDTVTMRVSDQGPGFDPGDVPDPTDPERIDLPSGRGLLLMRAYMTTVEFNDKGNEVRMVYQRPAE